MTDRAYGRISLDNERSASIDKQREQLTPHCRAGVEWYIDRSVSGSKVSFAERPEGGRLLRDLRAGDRVLVTKIDRASRSVRDLLGLIETINAKGASIVFTEQNIDTAGAFGRFLVTLLAAIAELEANIIGERRKESLVTMKNEGRHAVGSAPFGFVAVERSGGRGLAIRPDPETGPLLQQAIREVLGGATYKAAKAPLDLSMSGFKHLLRNPRLAGMTPAHQYEVYTNGQGNEQYRVVESGVVMDDGTPRIDPDAALLTMSEWMALQEMLESRKGKAWETAAGYGAALSCGVCGHRLYRAQSNSAPQGKYQCLREKHDAGQPGVAMSTRLADGYIEKTFLEQHGNRAYVLAKTVEDSGERLEAISKAKVALMSAETALRVADSEEAEDEAFRAVKAAKRAIKEAEAMPSQSRVEWVETGETVADVWTDADYPERCDMLRAVAKWNVLPGRMPVELRIVQTEPEVGASVVTRGAAVTVHLPT